MNKGIQIDYPKITRRRFLINLLATAAVNTLIAIVLTLIGFGWAFLPMLLFSQCIGLSIFLCNVAAFPIYRKAKRLSVQITVITIFVIIGATAGTVLGALVNGLNPFLLINEYSSLFSRTILISLLLGVIVSYIFISLGMLSQERVKRLEIEKTAAEAELKLLQSQMEPHFLFNTLSNIIGLIDSDGNKARRMLESLTVFLRGSLLTARRRTVRLSQELDLVRSYLDIFAVRMGDRLSYVIDVPENLRDFQIPPLLLQPLVENAVKHGLEPSMQGGTITVQAIREGSSVRISVSDTGAGINDKSSGSGISLGNIRERIELLYGASGHLSFEQNTPCGMKTTIELPYETDTSDHS